MNNVYPLEKFYIYFSPYTAHTLNINWIVYPTLEHAYQCQKYEDTEIIKEIIEAPSPIKAREISNKYKHLQIPEFQKMKIDIMKMLMKIKLEQHDDVRKALIESKNLDIIKHIVTYPPGDWFWDDWEDGKWLNHIGKIWMEIRKQII